MNLISVHIPKTAGTSFRLILEDVYKKETVFQDYKEREGNVLTEYEDLDKPRTPIVDILTGHRVVHGHFATRKYAGIFPEAKRVTWLRNPVSQIVSYYYYLNTRPLSDQSEPIIKLAHSLSLLDFARLPQMRNQYTRFYLRGYALDAYFFVGITEHFATDVADLATLLGWGPVQLQHVNRTTHAGYHKTLDLAVMEQIHLLNLADMAAYTQAVELRALRRRQGRAGKETSGLFKNTRTTRVDKGSKTEALP